MGFFGKLIDANGYALRAGDGVKTPIRKGGIRKPLQFIGGMIVFLFIPGCNQDNVDFSADVAVFGRYNSPEMISITIRNRGARPVEIYRPLYTQCYFWEFDVELKNGS